MQVSNPNNIKIYNLSAGKSIPEWLSEKNRRRLLKKNNDLQRRIELIQDFDMPGVSTSIDISRDGQYIVATGIYKPVVKCFDVNNLSLKFGRCFDSEVVTFKILSDDYSKMVFLQSDRSIEIHDAGGRYFRLRIPRFGRDLVYHYPSCDLFVVGVSNEIYRLNLERGQFLKPFETEASALNKCAVNPEHHLLIVGSQEGKIEAWDPRVKERVGVLDCGFQCVTQKPRLGGVPSITALNFNRALTLGVGTATGQVLVYDIRSTKPLIEKDHMNDLPIRNIEFHQSLDLVYSMDSSILKIWHQDTGNLMTSITAVVDFNDMCIVPNTGMIFFANEQEKMQSYYIPSLGSAPNWCSFLENLTEELEESNVQTIYDDYRFVTEKELEELGMSDMKGSPYLRAVMHGYYVDAKLYRKFYDIAKPFAFEEYKKKKIREKLEENRSTKINIEKLPQINKQLAMKLMEKSLETNPKKRKKTCAGDILDDDRFKALFSNPDFQVDMNSAEYALMNPVISQMDKNRAKKQKKEAKEAQAAPFDNDGQSEDSDAELLADSSSEDENAWTEEDRKSFRQLQKANKLREKKEEDAEEKEEQHLDNSEKQKSSKTIRQKFIEIKNDAQVRAGKVYMRKRNKATLGERLKREADDGQVIVSKGSREMTFAVGKKKYNKAGKNDRRAFKGLLRPAGNIGKRKNK